MQTGNALEALCILEHSIYSLRHELPPTLNPAFHDTFPRNCRGLSWGAFTEDGGCCLEAVGRGGGGAWKVGGKRRERGMGVRG